MTTELTKAAQLDMSTPTLREMVTRHALEIDPQATLEDMPEALAFQIDMARALMREISAITQRHVAQTEREAFEAWARPNGYDLRRNDVLGHYSSIDTSRAWAGFRAGRASLPAPQQATPEPVGEVVYQIRGEAFECPHAWRDATEVAFYATPTADRRILYTRPAPGVPTLSKDQIREVFLSHGFTVKDGQTDLKPYVYDAADALLKLAGAALAAQHLPRSNEEQAEALTKGGA